MWINGNLNKSCWSSHNSFFFIIKLIYTKNYKILLLKLLYILFTYFGIMYIYLLGAAKLFSEISNDNMLLWDTVHSADYYWKYIFSTFLNLKEKLVHSTP